MTLTIELKVVTQSGKHQLIIDKTGRLKCFVKAAPEDGKANKEVIEVVAKIFDVAKRDVQIASGLTSRNKVLHITTEKTYEQLLEKLGGGVQENLFSAIKKR